MGILSGAVSVRRYVVLGEVPEGFRDAYIEALNDNAFREPISRVRKEEQVGWVSHHNLLDTEFDDLNVWLYNHYAHFHLRVDKKTLPANLFRANLEKRVAAWCEEQKRERCPRAIRDELKEQLEYELLQKTLPRVRLYEVLWNVAEGWLVFHNQSAAPNDLFRKLFRATFGFSLMPLNPLDLLGDDALADALERTGGSDVRVESAGGGA